MLRFLRTCLPQSSSSSRSSTFRFRVLGQNPAARMASFQYSKHRMTEYADIPDCAMNSECEGAWPSFPAILAMESMMCFLSDTILRGTQVAQALCLCSLGKWGKFRRSECDRKKLGVGCFFRSAGRRVSERAPLDATVSAFHLRIASATSMLCCHASLSACCCRFSLVLTPPRLVPQGLFFAGSFKRVWISRSKASLSTMPGCRSAILPVRSMSTLTGIPLSTPNCFADSKVPITMR